MERIFGAGVGRKPVFSVNLLAPGGEIGKKIFLAFALFIGVGFRNHLAVGLYDLVIVIVDPDASLEIAFLRIDLLRCDIEHVAVQFILLLLPHVNDAVLVNVVAGENHGKTILEVVEIFAGHGEALKRGQRGKDDVLHAASLIVEADVKNLLKFTVSRLTIEGLHLGRFAITVLVVG